MRRTRLLVLILLIVSVIAFGIMRFIEFSRQDYTMPEIRMEQEEITISVNDPEDVILEGVTAYDKKDGNLSDVLVVEYISNFISDNRRIATLAVGDANGNISEAKRTIRYSDYHPPRFSLNGPLIFSVNASNTDILSGISATDLLDGSINEKIRIDIENKSSRSTAAGDYVAEVSVTNSAGDTSKLEVTLSLYDQSELNSMPDINLTEYLVYIKKGESIDPWSYVDSVRMNNTEYTKQDDGALYSANYQTTLSMNPEEVEEDVIHESEMQIANGVDSTIPGVYEVVYRIVNKSESTGTVRLIVVVTDEEA